MNPASNAEWIVFGLCFFLLIISIGVLIFGAVPVDPFSVFIV